MEKQYLSIRETAREFDIPELLIRRQVKGGNVPHIKSGVKVLISRESFREYLANLEGESVR
jgi:excisionase family DNA binding protein